MYLTGKRWCCTERRKSRVHSIDATRQTKNCFFQHAGWRWTTPDVLYRVRFACERRGGQEGCKRYDGYGVFLVLTGFGSAVWYFCLHLFCGESPDLPNDRLEALVLAHIFFAVQSRGDVRRTREAADEHPRRAKITTTTATAAASRRRMR